MKNYLIAMLVGLCVCVTLQFSSCEKTYPPEKVVIEKGRYYQKRGVNNEWSKNPFNAQYAMIHVGVVDSINGEYVRIRFLKKERRKPIHWSNTSSEFVEIFEPVDSLGLVRVQEYIESNKRKKY